MGSFSNILGASINNFIIYGNAQVLHIIIFLKLSKMALIKLYEQMLLKTFILATPNFVEVLNVMGSLCEFSLVYKNVLGPQLI